MEKLSSCLKINKGTRSYFNLCFLKFKTLLKKKYILQFHTFSLLSLTLQNGIASSAINSHSEWPTLFLFIFPSLLSIQVRWKLALWLRKNPTLYNDLFHLHLSIYQFYSLKNLNYLYLTLIKKNISLKQKKSNEKRFYF